MVNARKATTLIIAIFVAGLMAAFLLPIVIGSMGGVADATYNQSVGDTVELQPGLNATLDSTTAGSSATYTISAGNDSASATVNVGSNQTVTVDGADVTISPLEATSGYAVTNYEYPQTYGWGGSAAALWGILPVIVVLAVFLYFAYRAVAAF